MIKVNRDDYVYASARVRALENSLLTKDAIEKLIDAKSPEECIKILTDRGFGGGMEIPSPTAFEQLISAEQDELYRLVASIVKNPKIFDLFRLSYDYHNIKILLKSEFLGISDPDGMMFGSGTIPITKLKLMLKDKNYAELSSVMKKAIDSAREAFSKTGDPQLIDLELDRASFEETMTLARDLDSPFIKGYVALSVDLNNLKSYLRIKRMNKGFELFRRVFIDGGYISLKMFMLSFDDTVEQFAEKIASFGYYDMLSYGAAYLRETNKFTLFEKMCDNHLMDYIKKARYISFGIEPVVAFIFAKETELKTVRIVLASRLANLNAETIKERLRDTYV